MRTHFWQGEIINDSELSKRISRLNSCILGSHEVQFNIDEFYRVCGRFAQKCKNDQRLRKLLIQELVLSGETNQADAEVAIREITDFLNEAALRAKLNSEFGTDNPFRLQRVSKIAPEFESWVPLGFLVQILASNAPSLAILSAFEGLLTGNINFIKLSKNSSDFTIRFFDEFFSDPTARMFKDLLIVAKISSGEKNLLTPVMNEADGVVAWGGEESLNEIRKMTPARARLIEWGHRISFSYVTKRKMNSVEIFDQIATDVFLFDQQSCSSPQCLFIEDASFEELKQFGAKLGEAFRRRVKLEKKLGVPSDLEAAEITRNVLVAKTEMALKDDFSYIIEDANWRILIDDRAGLRASPLYRTLWLKPMKREQILPTLRPLGQYLQTLGLSCERDELYTLSQRFYKAGVTRIRPIGQMLDSYGGEPHDGVSALTRYMKKVSLEQNCGVDQYATLDDLYRHEVRVIDAPDKLMSKTDFQNMVPPAEAAEIYFQSGGSSGLPKISVFTYLDYHRQMKFAADGLMAAGLNPAVDKCMNLFFSGGLYGSFLSIFSVLEDIKAIQLPMAAHLDYDFVADMILKHKVNVLMGMPSYLLHLFELKEAFFKKNKIVTKIFYGGEAFNKKQIERLKNDFGIQSIISATYGSVDMGPLGYQCEHCDQGVHHLHQSLHHLEILDLEEDRPVDAGHPGRLVFTSYGRQGLNLLRYDIGDLGSWVQGACACGRLAPRFELLGRHGDIFRLAGNFLNYNKFAKLLAEENSYSYEFQLILDNDESRERLTLVLDANSHERNANIVNETRDTLLKNYFELQELVDLDQVALFNVITTDEKEFARSNASGKLLRIIDTRTQK